ncbi:hypothetical protein D3C71_1926130 [compost metagenome]
MTVTPFPGESYLIMHAHLSLKDGLALSILFIILHITLFLQTNEFLITDNDVIKHLNPNNSACFTKPLR